MVDFLERPGSAKSGRWYFDCELRKVAIHKVNMMMSSSRSSLLALICMLALPLNAMSTDLTIRFDGIGSVKLGTPLANIPIRLEQPIRKTDQQPSGHCFYASPENDQRFVLMFESDVLTRIDVMQPGVRTAAGIGIGDPVSKVREAYGRAIKEEPDFYDDRERYLTVSSKDGRHSIRFMTRDDKISAIISGTAKSVKYVEGCL